MPGIAGIIGPTTTEKDRRDLQTMLQSLCHDSALSSDVYADQAGGICIGWTSETTTPSDGMPVANATQDLLLFFHGAHYPDPGPIAPQSSPDDAAHMAGARNVLDTLDAAGLEGLRRLNGWFHGALVDRQQSRVTLFDDRYGMQRLYYHEDGDSLLFASEAKAILAVRPALRRFNPQSLGEYFACNCVLQDRTLFDGIYTLPGGSAWTYQRGRLQQKYFYFQPGEWERQEPLNEDDLRRQLVLQFPRIMDRYTQSSDPLGVSLTGGLDSRLLMAYLDHRRLRLRCYTFGGMIRESHDVKIARRVAGACGQPHEVIPLGQDFLISFPRLAERSVYISDGGLSAISAYELYLNQLARQIARIKLTGSYGSELFRGLAGFMGKKRELGHIHPDFHQHVRDAVATYHDARTANKLTFVFFKQLPWYNQGRLAVEQSQVTIRTPFTDNDLVGLMYRAPEKARANRKLECRVIEARSPALLDIPTDRGFRGRSGPFAERWSQMLSYPAFKADYLCKSGMPQWLEQIHYFLRPLQLDKRVLGSHRFFQFRVWFRHELAAHIQEILLDESVLRKPYFNAPFLKEMVSRHIKGDRNYTDEIDKVLTIELIDRLFIRGKTESLS